MKAKVRNVIVFVSLFFLFGFSWPFSWISEANPEKVGTSMWISKQMQIMTHQASGLNPSILKMGLKAYVNAKDQGLARKPVITIIDYSKPSTQKRLWVMDLKKNRVLLHTWVSHGKNSGGVNASSFSNKTGSLKSSLGVFLTGQAYQGGNGYSLRLIGLERGFNDNAMRRNVVIHGASYVQSPAIQSYARVGRSWGCPAVNPRLAKNLINTIKDKSLVFVYYPDKQWLSRSRFIS